MFLYMIKVRTRQDNKFQIHDTYYSTIWNSEYKIFLFESTRPACLPFNSCNDFWS